jgi:hypothetical protein
MAIKGMFASQSREFDSTRMAVEKASKSALSISQFVAKMTRLADEMASGHRKLEDEELVSYILT